MTLLLEQPAPANNSRTTGKSEFGSRLIVLLGSMPASHVHSQVSLAWGESPCGPHPPFSGGESPLGLNPLVAAANRCQTHISTMEKILSSGRAAQGFLPIDGIHSSQNALIQNHPWNGGFGPSINPLDWGTIHDKINHLPLRNKKDEHIQDQTHPFTDQAKVDRSL